TQLAVNADVARQSALVETLETELLASDAREEAAHSGEAEARAAAASVKLQVQELQTELTTLIKLLNPAGKGDWTPIVEAVRIAGGYEQPLPASLPPDPSPPAAYAAPTHS